VEDLFGEDELFQENDLFGEDDLAEEADDQGSPRGKEPAGLEDPLTEDDDPKKYEGGEDSLLRQGLAE
jgi:hypothetical protein